MYFQKLLIPVLALGFFTACASSPPCDEGDCDTATDPESPTGGVVCTGDERFGDTDGDGICDDLDVCEGDDATGDPDRDGVCSDLDRCDGEDESGDTDSDGVCDDIDSCPTDSPDDTDGDGVCEGADVCQGFDDTLDDDGDGVPDGCDLCEGDDNTGDTDTDGVCDDTDTCVGDDSTGDTDNDSVCDDIDVCMGNDSTGDTDNDGVCDDIDACSGDDSTGDADVDGVCDDLDVCIGDDLTGDSDADGVCDDTDLCPTDNPDDTDGDGVCEGVDVCFGYDDNVDTDSDGVADGCDLCDGDDATGDTDGDSVCDDLDLCIGDDATGDADLDSLCDDTEALFGTDPTNPDTNGNGIGDGEEYLGQIPPHDATRANSYDDAWQTEWVDRARTILQTPIAGIPKTDGKVIHVGDSMTYSNAYGSWARSETGATLSDLETLTWMHADSSDADLNGLLFSTKAQTSQSGAGWWNGFVDDILVDPTLNDAQFAVLMFNIPAADPTDLSIVQQRVDAYIAAGIVPILSTIPPRKTDAAVFDYNAELARPYNAALTAFAASNELPLINFHDEVVLRRPNDSWVFTLIGRAATSTQPEDGVHPTGGVAGFSASSDPYDPGGDAATATTGDAALNSGYLLRTWLTVQKMNEIRLEVVN